MSSLNISYEEHLSDSKASHRESAGVQKTRQFYNCTGEHWKKKLKWKVPSNGKGKRGRGSGEETMGSRPLERLPHRSTGATNHLLGLANEDNLSSWRRWGLQVWNRESCWRGDAGSPKTRRGSSAAAIGSCERGHELGLAGPRAGEDASGCPDEPARDSREGG